MSGVPVAAEDPDVSYLPVGRFGDIESGLAMSIRPIGDVSNQAYRLLENMRFALCPLVAGTT